MPPIEPNQPSFVPVDTPGGILQAPSEASGITYAPGHGSFSPPVLKAGPTIGGLLKSLQRRWLIACGLAVVLAGLVGAAVWNLVPAPYEATSYVQYQGSFPVYVTGKGSGYIDVADRMRGQAAYLRNTVVSNVMATEKIKSLTEFRDQGNVDEWATDNVDITFRQGDLVLPIHVEGEHPEDLKLIADEVAKEFLFLMAQKRLDYFTTLQQSRDNLTRKLGEKHDLKKSQFQKALAKIGKPQDQLAALKSQLQLNRDQQLKYSAELFGYEAELADLKKRAKITADDVADVTASARTIRETLRSDPEISTLDKEIALTQREYSTRESFTPEARRPFDRDLVRLRNELNKLKAKRNTAAFRLENQLHQEARDKKLDALKTKRAEEIQDSDRTIRRLRAMVHSLKEQEPLILAELQKVDPQLALPSEASVLALEIKTLEDQVRKAEEELAQLLPEVDSNDDGKPDPVVREQLGELPWFSISTASVPTSRDRKKQVMFTGVAVMGTCGMVLLGVAFFDFRSRRVSNAEEVVEGLGIPMLGSIPKLPASARSVNVASENNRTAFWQGRLMESIDALRTLLFRTLGDGPRVVMISSAVEGEGKTSLASQLAASCARSWRSTLLIDGDLRKPAAHELFGLPMEPGFSEVLRGEMDIEDVIRPTTLGRLSMMPAGRWDAHALQALAQEGAQSFFDQMKEEYEIIIVDSAPVLPVTDSLLLGQHVDTVILTNLRDRSRLPSLHAANQRLLAVGIPVLGAVLIGGSGDAADVGLQYPRYTTAIAPAQTQRFDRGS